MCQVVHASAGESIIEADCYHEQYAPAGYVAYPAAVADRNIEKRPNHPEDCS